MIEHAIERLSAPMTADKPVAQTRVVVAMSGGVDSAVTAALMQAAGYDVVGITLQLYDHGAAVRKPGACCAGQDIHDARRVADRIGIPHYVLDYENRFRQSVIDDFADSYLRGETPIPCVRCNQTVKFRDLLAVARDLDADALATGHYVRRIEGPAGPEMHRAADPARDQSYFLFATTAEQLSFLRFPLGDWSKPEIRALGHRLGVPVADKPDSQDICFVPSGRYAALVERLRPGAAEPGEIVHIDGRVLGRHDGVIHFTIGQRRRLNIGGFDGADSEPVYVVRLDPAARRVIVGPKAALGRDRLTLADVNWIGPGPGPAAGQPVFVKLRSAHQPVAARLFAAAGSGRATVRLNAPQLGVAPGQACVFYAPAAADRQTGPGTHVLGGGWIQRDHD